MSERTRIALVGDYNPEVAAHVAIPEAIGLAADVVEGAFECVWLETADITEEPETLLRDISAVWTVPASPYENEDGVLEVIRYAREADVPFLGTCGGYQHAVLEFARNVLGFVGAGNAEVDPDCEMPVINALSCALVETRGEIFFTPGSGLEAVYGRSETSEGYRCSYGVEATYLPIFEGSAMAFTGFDQDGDPRAFELAGHRFFIGTAFQPERSATSGEAHPIIIEFAAAALERAAVAA